MLTLFKLFPVVLGIVYRFLLEHIRDKSSTTASIMLFELCLAGLHIIRTVSIRSLPASPSGKTLRAFFSSSKPLHPLSLVISISAPSRARANSVKQCSPHGRQTKPVPSPPSPCTRASLVLFHILRRLGTRRRSCRGRALRVVSWWRHGPCNLARACISVTGT